MADNIAFIQKEEAILYILFPEIVDLTSSYSCPKHDGYLRESTSR